VVDDPLPGRRLSPPAGAFFIHPQFLDKNRRDIGRSQSSMDRVKDRNAPLTTLWRPATQPHARTHVHSTIRTLSVPRAPEST
jgi:hypothetical protein